MRKEKNPFSLFFDEKLKAMNENELTGKKLSKNDIAGQLGIGKEMFRKIINMNKPNQSRDCIIAIALVLLLNSEETDEAIQKYDKSMRILDTEDSRDDFIIELLEEQKKNKLSIEQVDQILSVNSYPKLDIIKHRKKNNDTNIIPLEIIDKILSYSTDDYLDGDIFNSLSTKYLYIEKPITAKMIVFNNTNNTKYSLKCVFKIKPYDKQHRANQLYTYHIKKENDEHFVPVENLNNFEVFKPFFIELKYDIKFEINRLLNIINDTRSYQKRLSAKIINNDLHVFFETYNYTVPELGEYYLMDYVNGKYTLYVSKESRFMKYYLSVERYKELFGKTTSNDKYEKLYTSLNDIECKVGIAESTEEAIIKLHIDAYNSAKKEIDSLIGDIISEKIYIRNLKMIFNNIYDVLIFYNVTNEFRCLYDPDYGEISGIGVEKVLFTLPNGIHIEFTFDNLCEAFKIGLNTIEEVCDFYNKHNTFNISELLQKYQNKTNGAERSYI